MAAQVVQWIGAARPAPQEPSGPERAKHAAHIVSVLNRAGGPGQVEELRRIAVQGGFLSAPLRRRVWPILLNLHISSDRRHRDGEPALEHREKKQVQLDVVRSMTHFAMRREEREARLKQLSRVIDAVLAANPSLHYYQGYNDVCSVAIMVMQDEHAARQLAEHLAQHHLREAMNPTMAAVQHALELMMRILRRRDRQLYSCLRACDVEPVFAISWIITWFAHDIKSLSQVERLYDFFLASHPLMSLYLSAAVLTWQREKLLQSRGDYSVVHQALQELPRELPLAMLIQDAHRMFLQAPPTAIIAEAGLATCQAFSAHSLWLQYPCNIQSDVWQVGAHASAQAFSCGGGWLSRTIDSLHVVWAGVISCTRGGKEERRGVMLLHTMLAGGSIVCVSLTALRAGTPALRALMAPAQ